MKPDEGQMTYGLIGHPIAHSLSPKIHALFGLPDYALWDLSEEEVAPFLAEGAFAGINVTIPYKQTVIPHLSSLSPAAERIGAANTIRRDADGTLGGHNTDYDGMRYALFSAGMDPFSRKVMILGSGGTSRTARYVVADGGAKEIVMVSRHADVLTNSIREKHAPDPAVVSASGKPVPLTICDYAKALADHADADLLINTTPVGMFREGKILKASDVPIDLGAFDHLAGVFDCVYNPLRTPLVLDAARRGIRSAGGFSMLVSQAYFAERFFSLAPDKEPEEVIRTLRAEQENIILCGMPGCGKSTVGRILAQKTGRPFVDLDEEIERRAGKEVSAIIEEDGEAAFRDLETAAAKEAGKRMGCIIACGGGIVEREENYVPLAGNGKIICLARAYEKLATDGRPLSATPEKLLELSKRRAPKYLSFADETVDNNGTPEETADVIFHQYFTNFLNYAIV